MSPGNGQRIALACQRHYTSRQCRLRASGHLPCAIRRWQCGVLVGIDEACSSFLSIGFLDGPKLRESQFAIVVWQLPQPHLLGPVQRCKRNLTRSGTLDISAYTTLTHRDEHKSIARGMRDMEA